MTRKSVKFNSSLRRGLWKANLTKHEHNDRHIVITSASAERWSKLKVKFRFKSDSDLVDYLLTLGEAQPKLSISPNHASEEVWSTPIVSERKKRGPSLRAVLLRRSTRNNGPKSDSLLESVESEELQTEDGFSLVDDPDKGGKVSESKSKSIKFKNLNHLLSKKGLQSDAESQTICNNDSEEAKADQLNAELALLVESVSLQPKEKNENELYEFEDDTVSENGLLSDRLDSSSSNMGKVSHKRWKSYHKDKRKWRQSYAAVMLDNENEETKSTKLKPREEGSSSCISEKDKKIFKALKKNRILTAYLDSQNQLAASDSKESCSLNKEDEQCLRDEDEKTEVEPATSYHRTADKVEVASNDDIEDEIADCAVGKENQSKPLNEPVFIEVGERVKLKRRKKKLLQDSEEPSSNLKDEDSSSLGDMNTTDLDKNHRKLRRNWKKSIINYEKEEMELDLKRKNLTSNITDNALMVPFHKEVKEAFPLDTSVSQIAPTLNESLENASHIKTAGPLGNETIEKDDVLLKTKNCPECSLRHQQQPCPVQNPLNVIEDSVTYEQWQLQCQIQVRCSVIEAPRPKPGRLRRNIPVSLLSTEVEKKNRESSSSRPECENSRMYAEESLPVGLGLQLINNEHGRSVFARVPIAQYTKFGPLVGPRIYEKDISDESDMRHIWEVLDGKHSIYLNTEDPQRSNWLRFMRPAPEKEERNVTLIVQNKELYFISVMEIPKGGELLYWADDHITTWSKKKILKSSCGGCNMRFAHPLYYRTHCAVFHDPCHSLTIRKYHCKVCGEAVMGKESIMKHAAELHEGRGAYQCQFCHKFFLRLNYLEMHRTYGCSSNPHRTRPLCDFCGRYFCQPQKLKVHIKRMHSDMNEVLRDFQCKSCLKILGSRAALQRHFKEVHHRDVVVTSNCDRCGKSFQNRSNLKIHMLTHSGVKPFRCQQEGCSAAFTTKQCLQFHYKKAHGLSEDSLPRIERSIAYTFDAYAGEAVDDINKTSDQMKKPQRVLRKGRKTSHKLSKNQQDQTQPIQIANQEEFTDPPPILSVENDTSVIASSLPSQANSSKEHQTYASVSDSLSDPKVLLSQKFDSSVPHRNPLSSRELISLPYGHDEKQMSCSQKTLTQLRTVKLLHHSDENYHSQSVSPMMCLSPLDTSSNQDSSKGHKKWLGEVIEVAEEAAAAAMRLSPNLKRDLYDFDDNKAKKRLQYDNPLRQDSQVEGMGRSKTASALAPFHHPESASMLVEAALDAAERDICCPNLATKLPSDPSHSPEPLHWTHPPYCVRSSTSGDLSNPSYYTTDPTSASISEPGHTLYPQNHSPHILPLDTYGIPSSHIGPSRLYNSQNHQMPQQQLMSQPGTHSSDDEGGVDLDCNSSGECAQNLSRNDKETMSSRPEMPSMYSVSSHHSPSGYQEHVALPHQNDLNFSSPRYHLYDLSTDRQRPDLSVSDLTVTNNCLSPEYGSYEEIGRSVDLSLPRGHKSSGLHSSESHVILVPSSSSYIASNISPGVTQLSSEHGNQYASSNCMPAYSPHPATYQNSPVQRSLISSSSNSPNPSPSPGPTHYHSYTAYY